jgi:hypothetical protein
MSSKDVWAQTYCIVCRVTSYIHVFDLLVSSCLFRWKLELLYIFGAAGLRSSNYI